jgi:putative FmdB family regulatory protein
MPIYAYRCERCGHSQDVMQKLSEAPLATCPACGTDAFRKQLTAPAFQLKGSGWYATDFRDNGKQKAAKPEEAGQPETGDKAPAEGGKGDAAPADKEPAGATAAGVPDAAKPTAPATRPAASTPTAAAGARTTTGTD